MKKISINKHEIISSLKLSYTQNNESDEFESKSSSPYADTRQV